MGGLVSGCAHCFRVLPISALNHVYKPWYGLMAEKYWTSPFPIAGAGLRPVTKPAAIRSGPGKTPVPAVGNGHELYYNNI